MLSAAQCLAKADEMDELAAECIDAEGSVAFRAIAVHWRQAAKRAREQEAWTVARPNA